MITKLKAAPPMVVEHLIAACYQQMPSIRHAIDLGAHSGFHTRGLSQLPSMERLLAVEANPRHHAALRAIAENSASVQLALLAVVSKATGSVTFKVSDEFHGRGGVKGLHIWPLLDPELDFEEIEVPTATLDELMRDRMRGQIDFIKLDLEGSELDLIVNSELLFQYRPICVMENSVHAPGLAGISAGDWVAFVRNRDCSLIDFDLAEINASRDLHRFNHAWLVPNEKRASFYLAASRAYEQFAGFR